MSLKVPCKHCGKEISLRKMPRGQYVPFDKWTNTQHRCQGQQAKATSKSDNNPKPRVHLDAGTSVGDLVLRVVSESPGLTAKNIASVILRKFGVNVDRSEINRWLYHDLKDKVYQNRSYQWFAGSVPSQRPSSASVGSGSSSQGATPVAKSGPAGNLQSSARQSSNKLLWAIIVLLVIVVLILLNKL